MCESTCIHFGGALVNIGGPVREIEVRGKTWLFEMPPYCGLAPMNKDGSMRESPWPKYVWDAVQAWSDQGRRVDDQGRCVWDTPKPWWETASPDAVFRHRGRWISVGDYRKLKEVETIDAPKK